MSFITSVLGFLTGGSKAADKAVDMVDKAFYTQQEQAKDGADDVANARAFQPAPSHESKWDIAIDGWHRAIRPAFATWAFLLLVGLIPPPSWNTIPQPIMMVILTILSFYFGGRTLVKDVPNMIARIMEILGRNK